MTSILKTFKFNSISRNGNKILKIMDIKRIIRILQKKQLNIQIEEVIQTWMPEYEEFWIHYRSQLIDQIFFTLKFWKNQNKKIFRTKTLNHQKYDHFEKKGQTKSWFQVLKIIECISFWNGFIEINGVYPPKFKKKPLPIIKRINPTKKGHSFAVIIPIGSNRSSYLEILKNSLDVLAENKMIKRVYCISDGIDLPKWFHSIFERINKIKFSKYPNQSGPATIRNYGIQLSRMENHTDIILMDSDIYLTQKSLSSIIEKYFNSDALIVFPKIVSKTNSILDTYYNLNGILNGRILQNMYPNKPKNSLLLYGTTSFVMINQIIFHNHVLFDENFSLAGGEDIDFCINLVTMGFALTGYDDISIIHDFGCEEKIDEAIYIFKKRFERYGRGDAILLKKHPYFYHWLNQTIPRI